MFERTSHHAHGSNVRNLCELIFAFLTALLAQCTLHNEPISSPFIKGCREWDTSMRISELLWESVCDRNEQSGDVSLLSSFCAGGLIIMHMVAM